MYISCIYIYTLIHTYYYYCYYYIHMYTHRYTHIYIYIYTHIHTLIIYVYIQIEAYKIIKHHQYNYNSAGLSLVVAQISGHTWG